MSSKGKTNRNKKKNRFSKRIMSKITARRSKNRLQRGGTVIGGQRNKGESTIEISSQAKIVECLGGRRN